MSDQASRREDLDEPVRLLRTPREHQAQWIADELRESGIPAAVVGAHTSALVPLNGGMLPVWVMVPRRDYELAREALATGVIGAPGLPDEDTPPSCRQCAYDLSGLADADLCPECGTPVGAVKELVYDFAPPPTGQANRAIAVIASALTLVVILGGLLVIILAVI